MNNKIIIIVTNYNNTQLTLDFYRSCLNLYNHDRIRIVEFIVVDNCSADSERNILYEFTGEERLKFSVIYSDSNIGYFKGLNLGLDYLIGNKVDFDFVVVGNNDMLLPRDFLAKFSEAMIFMTDFPVICPNLIDLDGNHQNPHLFVEISLFRRLVHGLYYSNFIVSKIISHVVRMLNLKRKVKHFDAPVLIESGYGACYILTRSFFNRYNRLFDPFFLMYEEAIFTQQIKQIGHKMLYVPGLVIYHLEHSTFNKMSSFFTWKCGRDSHFIYKKRVKLLEDYNSNKMYSRNTFISLN